MFGEEPNPSIFHPIIGSWYKSLEDPQESQRITLLELIKGYGKTFYGKSYNASEINEITDFKAKFPVINYEGLNKYFAEVQKGNYNAILPEPLECWVMTRGSTGRAKVLPATKTHLSQIFTCGARALVNHVLRTKDFELFTGKILNLNFPSQVHTMTMNGRTVTYGYSSGTYAKLNPMLNEVSLLPRQECLMKSVFYLDKRI